MRRLCFAAALLVVAAAPSARAEPGPRRLGLVVSGGVSEGAYQAGATYALLRHYLARREGGLDLEIASGASAGNINVVLASTFWLGADTLSCEAPMGNIFYDTWVNVGWDRLAPIVNDWGSYAPLFAPEVVLGKRKDDDAVYTGEDGIVTRSALVAVLENARQRMRGRWRKGARVDLGITMTGEAVAPLPLQRGNVSYCPPVGKDPRAAAPGGPAALQVQRYVVPFTFEAPASDGEADIAIKSVREGWPSDHGRIGHVLPLAAPGAKIEVDLLLHAVMAAKGFPIAFGPKALGGHCATNGLRFWDGGLFDNVPVSLLFELNHERARQGAVAGKPDPIKMIYVDAALVRPEARGGEAPVKRGLGLLADIFAQRLTEARQFELQAIPRFNREELERTTIEMPDRFFPLTAHKLPSAFGAFLHEAFRRHDYLVGLYDGVFALARDRANGAASSARAENWPGLIAAFEDILAETTRTAPAPAACRPRRDDRSERALLARSFLQHLLAAELRVRAPSTLARRYEAALAPREQPGDDVWQVFDSIYEAARHREGLVAAGDPARLAAFDADEGSLQGFLRRLPPRLTRFSRHQAADPRQDPDGFLAESGDRLLRRALDIEKADQARLPPDQRGDSKSMEWLLTWGRLGLASALERSPHVLDIDSSSVGRLGVASPFYWRWLGHLVPHYLASQITACRHEIGWHPRLRNPWGWGQDGRHWSAGLFLASNVSLQKRFLCSAPDRALRLQPAGGLGFDFAGRLLDDLQALATFTRTGGAFDRAGFELGLTVATKVRLALGVDDLFWRRGGGRFERGWGRLHVSLGVADLNGLLYWLVQSWFDPQYGREAKLDEEIARGGTP